MKPLTPATPHVIIMVGIPGAGKTTFAEHFAKTFQAPMVDYRLIGRIAQADDKAAAKVAVLMLNELLKTQRTIIFEGPTSTKAARLEISKHVLATGYKPLLVWVQTESTEAKRRATKKQKDITSLTSEEFDKAIERFNAPAASESPVVISGKHTYATQLKIILKHLAGKERALAPTDEEARPRSTRNIILR